MDSGPRPGRCDDVIEFMEAFAAGAIVTMLADDRIPNTFRGGDKLPGVAIAAGFAVAGLLSFNTRPQAREGIAVLVLASRRVSLRPIGIRRMALDAGRRLGPPSCPDPPRPGARF